MKLRNKLGVLHTFKTGRELEANPNGKGNHIRWWPKCLTCEEVLGLDSTDDYRFAKKRMKNHTCR